MTAQGRPHHPPRDRQTSQARPRTARCRRGLRRRIRPGRITATAGILLALAVLAGLPPRTTPPAHGQPPATTQPRISNVFLETDLRQALQDISLQAGTPVIAGPRADGLVTADLMDVPLERALEIVLAGTECKFIRRAGYYLVYHGAAGNPIYGEVAEPRVMQLDHISGGNLAALLPQPYRPYVSVDTDANIAVILADSSLGHTILQTIEDIDVARRHVMLDARVVVLEQGDVYDLGVDWQLPSVEGGVRSDKDLDGSWPWRLDVGLALDGELTQSLLLDLELLDQNDEATVLSSPQVVAQSGKPAEIKVATEEYFKITTEGIYERLRLEKIETGTHLTILPQIGDRDQITLEVSAEVSDVIARGTDNLPVVNRRSAQSTLRLEDGGTAAIAGLLATRERKTDRGIPILSSLPLVGGLFSKSDGTQISKQLAIFITARLIPEDTGKVLAPPDTTGRVALVREDAFRRELEAILRGGDQ